jgi:hypothetical protein
MLTVDEQFEAIVADVSPSARMEPYQEPEPETAAPVKEEGDAPEKPKKEDKKE